MGCDVRDVDVQLFQFVVQTSGPDGMAVPTICEGLLLFQLLLETIDLGRLANRRARRGSGMIPDASAFRALMTLDPWGTARPLQALATMFDDSMALFCGLTACPKRTTVTEYGLQVDAMALPG